MKLKSCILSQRSMVSTSELPQSALSEAAAGAFSVNLGAAQQKL